MKIIKSNKGFSLLELIVALAIILIVIGIGVPSFIGIRDNAQETGHQANVRMLENSATIFALENPGKVTIWCPHEGVEANPDIEITETNLHDSWQKYLKEWPACPIGGTYTVEIKADGRITVLPEVEP